MKKTFIKLICAFIPSKTMRREIRDRFSRSDGYNNKWTRQIRATAKKVGKNLWCGAPVILNKNTYLGDSVHFNGCRVYGEGRVSIGSHFHSGVELMIIAQNHNYDGGEHIPYSPRDYTYKDIEIGDFVWVGSRVIILPGTKIGEGAIIQAGAVVRGEVPPHAIAGGNPAEVFKYRNIEHFKKLKAQGKFN